MEIVDLADEFVHDASDETEDVRESLADEFVHDASDETEDVRESLGDSEVFSRCKRAVMVASCFVGSSKSLLALWALQGTASAPAARSSPSALALVDLRSLASRAGGGAAPLSRWIAAVNQVTVCRTSTHVCLW